MRISDWSSDVCSSDLVPGIAAALGERTRALDDALDANGLSTWKTPGHAPHLTALRPPAERLDAVFDTLARERIACTRRHGLLRIAPHLHVTPDDMARVANVAAAAACIGRRNGCPRRNDRHCTIGRASCRERGWRYV